MSKEVSEIPLNGRQRQELITLSAGVNPGATGETGPPNSVTFDAVREFSVQTGDYSAEFGDVAGGVVNLQSRSGTNSGTDHRSNS